MDVDEFKKRTKKLGLRVIRLAESLPATRTSKVIGNQLIRSGTAVGSNYRAACRAKSGKDFIAKMKIVEEECDESIYWIEMLVEAGEIKQSLVANLLHEAQEVLKMTVASIKTARCR